MYTEQQIQRIETGYVAQLQLLINMWEADTIDQLLFWKGVKHTGLEKHTAYPLLINQLDIADYKLRILGVPVDEIDYTWREIHFDSSGIYSKLGLTLRSLP